MNAIVNVNVGMDVVECQKGCGCFMGCVEGAIDPIAFAEANDKALEHAKVQGLIEHSEEELKNFKTNCLKKAKGLVDKKLEGNIKEKEKEKETGKGKGKEKDNPVAKGLSKSLTHDFLNIVDVFKKCGLVTDCNKLIE